MSRLAFIDPVTKVLKCHGFVSSNQPGDVVVPVPDDFSLTPGLWQWNGTEWVAFTPPPPPPDPRLVALGQAIQNVTTDPGSSPALKGLMTALKNFLGA